MSSEQGNLSEELQGHNTPQVWRRL